MAFATLRRRMPGTDFADAIRSIALQELDGEDAGRRSAWLANRAGVGLDAVRIQVDEMIDLLAH